jgi:uncharacterized protein
MMQVGIVSDTHGWFDPGLRNKLAGVDRIVHAGDVGSPAVLDELSLIAPVVAVKGNIDSESLRFRLSMRLFWDGTQIEVLHELPVGQAWLEEVARRTRVSDSGKMRRDRFLSSFHPATRVVVFGHSHQPCLVRFGNKLFVNPGSAGKKRFRLPRCCAMMTLSARRVAVKILTLEAYNQFVPASVEVALGE